MGKNSQKEQGFVTPLLGSSENSKWLNHTYWLFKYLEENADKVLLNETANQLNGRNSTGTNCTGKSLSEALIF